MGVTRLRREIHEASAPLNPGGELPPESKNLIRDRVRDARQRQTWHIRNKHDPLPRDLYFLIDFLPGEE